MANPDKNIIKLPHFLLRTELIKIKSTKRDRTKRNVCLASIANAKNMPLTNRDAFLGLLALFIGFEFMKNKIPQIT